MSEKSLTQQLREHFGLAKPGEEPVPDPDPGSTIHIDYSGIEQRLIALDVGGRGSSKAAILMALQKAEIERITGTKPDLMIVDEAQADAVGEILSDHAFLELKTAASEPTALPRNRRSKRQANKNARTFGFSPTGRKLFRP